MDKFVPIISVLIDIVSHTLVESQVEFLDLPLHLRIKECRIDTLDRQKFAHFLEMFGHEFVSSIRSDGSRAAQPRKYLRNQGSSHRLCILPRKGNCLWVSSKIIDDRKQVPISSLRFHEYPEMLVRMGSWSPVILLEERLDSSEP